MAEAFGRFWLQQKIGQGGMAEIFRATIGPGPSTYAFDFVIKRLLPSAQKDAAQRDMFLTEADLAVHLRHGNLVQVFESGLVDGRAYIAMERVWGLDLARLLSLLRRRGLHFPADLAVYTAMQVLRALDYVHRARAAGGSELHLIHRDVTPSNIFVSFSGDVKLGDFGVAHVRFLEGNDDSKIIKGKVAYTPPEVIEGHEISQQDDVWAVSLCLYEMLAGRSPYSGIDEADLVSGAVRPKIAPIRKVQPDIDAKLAEIVARAVHPQPRRRPPDAVALYRQLKGYLAATGVRVDGHALARFVRSAAGEEMGQERPVAPVTELEFIPPEDVIEQDLTPTQRIELQRRVRRRKPWLAVAALVFLVVVGWASWTRLRGTAVATPRTIPATLEHASALLESGKLDAAALMIEELVQREPRRAEVYLAAATLHRKRGQVQKARLAYRRVVSLDPTDEQEAAARRGLRELGGQ